MDISKVIRGAAVSEGALNDLYDFYFERFYQFFAYRVADQSDVEDLNGVLWEKILKSLSKISSFERPFFEAWCFKVARNLVIDFYKSRKGALGTIEEAEGVLGNFDVLGDQRGKEDLERLFVQVEALPRVQREVFKLRFFDELSNKEIAVLLEMQEKTVASNIVRARTFLKENFLKCSNFVGFWVLTFAITFLK